ncbi:phosphodiesterase [Sporobacter termitidis]|nr:phosphodiesterase [Sporobacter termitidis]
MKLMIASDIHGSAYYGEKLIQAFDKEKADRLLLLGDLLYHGPRNDLPEDYRPKRVIELLNGLKAHILCVRGNCEAEVDQAVLEFPVLAEYCVLWLGGRMIFATHGHRFDKDNPPPLHKGDILLYGHTHVPLCEVGETFISLNPGSVSIPKENSPHSYMTLEDGLFKWKDIEGDTYRSFAPD